MLLQTVPLTQTNMALLLLLSAAFVPDRMNDRAACATVVLTSSSWGGILFYAPVGASGQSDKPSAMAMRYRQLSFVVDSFDSQDRVSTVLHRGFGGEFPPESDRLTLFFFNFLRWSAFTKCSTRSLQPGCFRKVLGSQVKYLRDLLVNWQIQPGASITAVIYREILLAHDEVGLGFG